MIKWKSQKSSQICPCNRSFCNVLVTPQGFIPCLTANRPTVKKPEELKIMPIGWNHKSNTWNRIFWRSKRRRKKKSWPTKATWHFTECRPFRVNELNQSALTSLADMLGNWQYSLNIVFHIDSNKQSMFLYAQILQKLGVMYVYTRRKFCSLAAIFECVRLAALEHTSIGFCKKFDTRKIRLTRFGFSCTEINR